MDTGAEVEDRLTVTTFNFFFVFAPNGFFCFAREKQARSTLALVLSGKNFAGICEIR